MTETIPEYLKKKKKNTKKTPQKTQKTQTKPQQNAVTNCSVRARLFSPAGLRCWVCPVCRGPHAPVVGRTATAAGAQLGSPAGRCSRTGRRWMILFTQLKWRIYSLSSVEVFRNSHTYLPILLFSQLLIQFWPNMSCCTKARIDNYLVIQRDGDKLIFIWKLTQASQELNPIFCRTNWKSFLSFSCISLLYCPFANHQCDLLF